MPSTRNRLDPRRWASRWSRSEEPINDSDYPAIQGFVVLAETVFIVVNLVVDLAYLGLDPGPASSGTQQDGVGLNRDGPWTWRHLGHDPVSLCPGTDEDTVIEVETPGCFPQQWSRSDMWLSSWTCGHVVKEARPSQGASKPTHRWNQTESLPWRFWTDR